MNRTEEIETSLFWVPASVRRGFLGSNVSALKSCRSRDTHGIPTFTVRAKLVDNDFLWKCIARIVTTSFHFPSHLSCTLVKKKIPVDSVQNPELICVFGHNWLNPCDQPHTAVTLKERREQEKEVWVEGVKRASSLRTVYFLVVLCRVSNSKIECLL